MGNKPDDWKPHSREEINIMIEVAQHFKAYEADLPFRIIPFTGLSGSEFVHLRENWINWNDHDEFCKDQPPIIRIPRTDQCRNLKWHPKPPITKQKSRSCRNCQNYGKTNNWESRGHTDVRSIPVLEPIAEQALRRWFKTLGHNGVPGSVNHMSYLTKRVEQESSINRRINLTTLQHTFPHICAEQGLAKEDILDITYYSQVTDSLRAILANSSTEYKFHLDTIDRIRMLKKIQPASASDLAEVTGKAYTTESENLRRLAQLNLLEIVERTGHTNKLILYKVSEDVDVEHGLLCPRNGCDRYFSTLKGRSLHISMGHD